MKRNFSATLYTLTGEPFKKDDKTDLPLYWVCIEALTSPDNEASAEERMKRYTLAKRLTKGGEVDVSTDEIVLIKARIQKTFPSIALYGAVHEALEGEE